MSTVVPGAGRALQRYGLEPDTITPLSFERLRARSPVALPAEPAATVMLRMAYAAGDPDLLRDIVAPAPAVQAAGEALGRGAEVICDVAMVVAGIRTLAMQCGSTVVCAQDVDVVARGDENLGSIELITATTRRIAATSTRTARGLLALAHAWRDAVVLIGNAPTALLAMLDALADGVPAPAVLIATPCGMVAAQESKQLLLQSRLCPFITVRGTRGGSAVAAAAFNACAILATSAGPQDMDA
jgi:precorrin isomerase